MNIYAGNLVAETTESQIRRIFARFGTVGRITMDRPQNSNAMHFFCFVEMPNQNEALEAIQELDGRNFAGNRLSIKESGVTA